VPQRVDFGLNNRLILILPLILAAALFAISSSVPSAHAATGLVCITASTTATNCPASPPTIANLAAGSTLTIGVFIQGSDPMGGFDIYVKTDNTVLNPTAAVFGPLIAHPSSSIRCINNVGVEGACTLGTANAPGVVEMETIESTGVNECFGQASCSGLAFNITYTVQASSGTTPIAYPKAAGCTSSTADPTDCVLVFDSIGNILVETVQAGTYGVVTKDNTSTSVACSPGSIVPTGVSTCTATVTDTTTASNTPTGTFSFTSSNTAVGTVGASCILSSGKCSVAFTGVAAGTATVTGVYGGDSTHSGSQGTSGTISVAKDSTSTSVGNVSCNIALGASSCTASVTATVADTTTPSSAPAGTVTFTLTAGTTGGSLSSPTCSLSTTSGVTSCSVTFTGTTAGSGSVIAGYGGDATHNTSTSSAATVTVTVSSKDNTSTSVGNVSCNIALGGTSCIASVTATVADTTTASSAPAGTVTFTLTAGTTGGSLSSPTCSLSTTSGVTSCSVTFTGTTAGSGSVIAGYGGDATHNTSSSAAATVTVTASSKDSTSTSVGSVSCNIASGGTSCTASVTATVVDTMTASNAATGTVTFTLTPGTTGGVLLPDTCNLSTVAGVTSCSVSFTGTTAGSGSVTAVYGGDSTHNTSTSPAATVTVTVTSKDSTSTSVGDVSCNIALGASSCTASVTATVADTTTPSSAPTGTVTFTLTLGTTGGSLDSNTCSLSTVAGVTSCSVTFTGMTAGSGSVTASYGGDATDNGSTSAPATVTVTVAGKDDTSTSVACSPSSIGPGATSTCMVTVTDTATASNTPTGSVDLISSNTSVGTVEASCTLTAGSCSATFTAVSGGTAILTGNYGGDASHNPSSGTSNTITVTVPTKDDTSTSVACTRSSISVGSTSSCSVTVADTTAPENTATGSVSLVSSDNSVGTVDASCTLTSGSCTVTFTGVAAGTATVTATYRGDSTHNGSIGTSGSITVTAVTGQNDFTISASPTSLNVVGESALCEGGSTLCDDEGSTTITLTSINGFDGAIRLARSVSPRNGLLTVYCRPAATQLMPGATVKIRCFVEPEVNPDSQTTFTVKITGRFGALGSTGFLSHSVTITVTVTHAPTPSEDNEGDPLSTLLAASTGTGSTGATTVVGGLVAASRTRADSRGHSHGHGHVCGATAATTATPHNSSPRFLGPSFWDD